MTTRPFPGSSVSRRLHFASSILFFAGITSIASLANASETEEKSLDDAVVSHSPAPKRKNLWAFGLEASTLKFLGDAAIRPTFGGRLFGTYYFDKKVAAGAGFSYYLPAHYDDMSYGYRLSDPNGGQVQVPIDASVGPMMVDLELEYHFVGEQLRTDKRSASTRSLASATSCSAKRETSTRISTGCRPRATTARSVGSPCSSASVPR